MKRLLAALVLLAAPAQAATLDVADGVGLYRAMRAAKPGDLIQLAPGDYEVGHKLVADRPGPIVVRGPGRLLSRVTEAFHVLAPGWSFEGFAIEGVCARQHDCEHAFHIVGDADGTAIRDVRMIDFNAQIKANGDGRGAFPDDVLVADSVLANRTVRDTDRPVALIDVVGGRRWIVRGNVVADFAQGRGQGVGFGVFLKGGSRDGLIERNVVLCEWRHRGGFRIGLSFGGSGGEPASICEEGRCRPRHSGGVMRHNVVLNCPRDAGVYVNRAAHTRLERNTLYDSLGVDVRFPESQATLAGNVLSAGVLERDGGKAAMGTDNLIAGSSADAVFPAVRRDDDLPPPTTAPEPPAADGAALGRDRLHALMRDAAGGDFCLKEAAPIGAEICDVRAALRRLEAAVR